jgi:hypothetical protein
VLLARFYSGDQIRKNEMREHVRHVGKRTGAYRVCWENVGEREHLGDIGVIGRIIVNWIFKKCDGGVDWKK